MAEVTVSEKPFTEVLSEVASGAAVSAGKEMG